MGFLVCKIYANDNCANELAKRRGFFWQSYEIYGGTSGFVTFGPLGAMLKRRIEDKFREFYTRPLGILEIESSVILPSKSFRSLRTHRPLQRTLSRVH
jgi:glycyl-tRNA synthetase (class II)